MKDYKPNNGDICAFNYASPSLKDDKEFVIPYIKNAGYLLKQISERLKNDYEVCIAAMSNDFNVIYYAVGKDFYSAWSDGKLKQEIFIYDENQIVYDSYLAYIKSIK